MLKGIQAMISALLGSVSYTPPTWMSALNSRRQANPVAFALYVLLLISLLVVFAFYVQSYLTRPAPPLVYATIELNQQNTYSRKLSGNLPAPLFIRFSQPQPQPLSQIPKTTIDSEEPSVNVPIASIDTLNKDLTALINLTPKITGEWRWENDSTLVFEPSASWPAGQKFDLELNGKLFNPVVKLAQDELAFKTDDLTISIDAFTFYQNPQAIEQKSLNATISSNYELDSQALAGAFLMTKQSVKEDKQTLEIKVTRNESNHEYYLSSEIQALPFKEEYATLTLNEPLKASVGGTSFDDSLEAQVVIPDVYSFLDIVNVEPKLIEDANSNPIQTLTIEFTDAISRSELVKKLMLYQLPEKDAQGRRHQWTSPAQVPDTLKTDDNIVEYALLNDHLASSTNHVLKVDLIDPSHLLLVIEGGLSSINAYVKTRQFDTVVQVPAYPQEVFFAHEGAALSSAFSPQLGIGSRGVDALSIELGQIPLNQVIHLVTQTRGDITNLDFQNWSFNERNLAHFSRHIMPLKQRPANKINKTTIDLENYFEGFSSGLFIVKTKAYDPKRKRDIYGVEDKKLVMVTDIGLLVKHEKNQRLKVFAQSLSTQKPIAGVEVSVLMPNGKALLSAVTSRDGVVSFEVPRNLASGEYPSVITAKKAQDFAFIAFDKYFDQIDYSRMDSGGVSTYWGGENKVSAFVFNDRGIYRPGESVKLAAIVKDDKLTSANKLNLKWIIRNPSYQIVHEKAVSKGEDFKNQHQGFIETEFSSLKTDEIGIYTATLHLISSSNTSSAQGVGRQIGSTTFTIRAFEPDTLRLEAKIKNSGEGSGVDLAWRKQSELSVDLRLSNLFGTPAVGNRISADVSIQEVFYQSTDYPDYSFYVPKSDALNGELAKQSLTPQISDQQGKATAVYGGLNTSPKAGLYRIDMNVKAFELDSGRFVDTRSSVLFSPLDSLIAHKVNFNPRFLEQNQTAELSLINFSHHGELAAKAGLTLKYLQKKPVMALVKQPNGSLQYQQEIQLIELSETSFEFTDTPKLLNLDTSDIGQYSFQIRDNEGLLVFEFDYTVMGESDKPVNAVDSNQLTLTLNKNDLKAGEALELSIQAPYLGSGLITIETDKVEYFQWFTASTLTSIHTISVPEHLEGNAYVNVAFIRDPSSTSIAFSPFSYGLVNFTIDRSKRILKTSIDAKAVINPEARSTVRVSLEAPAKLLLFAVDQGILQVANYQAPDPLSYFLRKKALGVRSHQMLDALLPDLALTSYAKAPGGDVVEAMMMRSADVSRESKSNNPFERDTLDPIIYWSSIVDGQQGNNEFEVDLPDDFNGELRFFAIAVNDSAIGTATHSSLVQSNFLIASNLPTHLSPTDEIKSRLRIQAFRPLKSVDTPITIDIEASPQISLLSNKTYTMIPNTDTETIVDLHLQATKNLGPAYLDITASAKGKEGEDLVTKRRFTLSNRPLAQSVKVLQLGVVENQTTIPIPFKLLPEFASQSLSYSATPSALLEDMYLAIAKKSGADDQFALENQATIDTLIQLKALIIQPLFDATKRERYQQFVEHLMRSQIANGGFSYWPNGLQADVEVSLDVFEFLIDARNRQRVVDNRLFERSLDFVTNIAKSSSDIKPVDRAKAIYLLTLNGIVSTNYLLNLEQEIKGQVLAKNTHNQLLAYRAASFHLLQQNQKAQDLLSQLDWDDLMQSDALGVALNIIALLNRHFDNAVNDRANNLLATLYPLINKGVSPHYWVKLIQIFSLQLPSNKALPVVAVEALQNDQLRALTVANSTPSPLSRRLVIPTASSELKINASSKIFYLLAQTGYEQQPSKLENNVQLTKSFFDSDGKLITLANDQSAVVELGKDITVKVTARTKGGQGFDNVMLIDLLPAGFSIVPNSLIVDNQYSIWPRYKADLKEDRVHVLSKIDSQGLSFSYQIRPTTRGTVLLPSLSLRHTERYDVYGQTPIQGSITIDEASSSVEN